jgi:ligand-binding sensor domain-containing protein
MKRYLFILVFIVCVVFLNAQREDWHVYHSGLFAPTDIFCSGDYIWLTSMAGIMRMNTITDEKTHFNENNTPSQSSKFFSVCGDDNGDIWVGGESGAMHYSSNIWSFYTADDVALPADRIRCIRMDESGGLWFASDYGVSSFIDGTWSAYNSTNSVLPIQYTCWDLEIDPNGNIWMATNRGLFMWDGVSFTDFDEDDGLPYIYVTSIAFDQNGKGWFAHSSGVLMYDNNIWQDIRVLDGQSISGLRGMYLDNNGCFWVWNWSQLRQYNGSNWQIYLCNEFTDHNLAISDMLMDSHGVFWLLAYDTYSPLSLLKWEGGDITQYQICELPLPSSGIQEVIQARDGKMWIATSSDTGGYMSVDGEDFQCYGVYNTNMPCDHAWSLAQDSERNIWVGTCIGLVRNGPSGSLHFSTPINSVSFMRIKSICAVNDEVWIANSNGVGRYRDGEWDLLSTTDTGFNLSSVNVIKTDPSGDVWIGCSNGLCHYDHESFTCYPTSTVYDIAFTGNFDVWVAHGKLSLLQEGSWTHFDSGNSALESDNICCVAVDHNNVVWAGTDYDQSLTLYRYDQQNWLIFDGSNSPLDGSRINVLFVDEDNTLWIGSNSLYLYNEGGLPISNAGGDIAPALTGLCAYPNPFGQELKIGFTQKNPGPLSLNVYNIKGQKVYCKEAFLPEGEHILSWDGKDFRGRNCAPGIYLIRYRDATQHLVKRILKL